MRNVPDLEEGEVYEQLYREQAEVYSDFADAAYADGEITVYRAIRLPRVNGLKAIRYDCLGKACMLIRFLPKTGTGVRV